MSYRCASLRRPSLHGSVATTNVLLAIALTGCASDRGLDDEAPIHGRDAGVSDAGHVPDMSGHDAGTVADSGVGEPVDGEIGDAGYDAGPVLSDPDALEPRLRTGAVLDDDSTVWCITRASGEAHGRLEAFLRRVPSDARADIEEPFRFPRGRVIARMTCTEHQDGSGSQELLETDASLDADDDRTRGSCPAAQPYGRDPQCELLGYDEAAPDSAVELRSVSLPATTRDDGVPAAQGVRCIGSITDWQTRGQVTGFVAEYMNAGGNVVASLPLENETLMRNAQVGGTDEGSPFLAQGKLWFVFGDTSALDANDPLTVALQGPGLWRSNVLAYMDDLDVSDGFRFAGFETVPGSQMAAERVVSPHDMQASDGTEVTAIPLAGFGFTSQEGERYRFLWFVSIHAWSAMLVGPDFVANYSTLAYVKDDQASWTRLASPVVPAEQLGPGAVWFDRYHRYLYFFGVTPDRGAIRLGRARSTFEDVTDPTRYEYWDGATWIEGDVSAATALIDTSSDYAPRSEISVAWNAAAEVWMMMLVNWYSDATPSNQVELWQAPAVTGPWTKVDADAQLPNGARVLQYGPMINEHLFRDGGLEVPFLLSQLFPVYNVHHHSYRIVVAEGESCAATDL